MRHLDGTTSEQVNFRHGVAIKLDNSKFCDLIVDMLEHFTGQKACPDLGQGLPLL